MRRYGLWQSNDIWLDSLTSGFVLLHLLINAATRRERKKRKNCESNGVFSSENILCTRQCNPPSYECYCVCARERVWLCAPRTKSEFSLSFSRLPNVGAVRSICMFAHLSFCSEWYKKYGRQVVPYKWNLHLLQGPRVAGAARTVRSVAGFVARWWGWNIAYAFTGPIQPRRKEWNFNGETEGGAHSNDFKRLLLCAECV